MVKWSEHFHLIYFAGGGGVYLHYVSGLAGDVVAPSSQEGSERCFQQEVLENQAAKRFKKTGDPKQAQQVHESAVYELGLKAYYQNVAVSMQIY